jgi:hypothetical protein
MKRGHGYTLYSLTLDGDYYLWDESYTWYGDVTAMKKKVRKAEASDLHHLASVESNVFARMHGLVAHCATTKYEDGDVRRTGWVTIKTMGSAWVVECKDPDTCATLRVVQQSLDEALLLAAMLLESDEAPWEPDTWLQQQAKKNKGK